MAQDRHFSADIAKNYCGVTTDLVRLGWGISGYVYLSPDSRTAIKVHSGQDGFDRELQVYRQLDKLKINNIQGLTVPKLWDARPESKLLRIEFVKPPYLLDFAGADF
jgi:hypothetical protein